MILNNCFFRFLLNWCVVEDIIRLSPLSVVGVPLY